MHCVRRSTGARMPATIGHAQQLVCRMRVVPDHHRFLHAGPPQKLWKPVKRCRSCSHGLLICDISGVLRRLEHSCCSKLHTYNHIHLHPDLWCQGMDRYLQKWSASNPKRNKPIKSAQKKLSQCAKVVKLKASKHTICPQELLNLKCVLESSDSEVRWYLRGSCNMYKLLQHAMQLRSGYIRMGLGE